MVKTEKALTEGLEVQISSREDELACFIQCVSRGTITLCFLVLSFH